MISPAVSYKVFGMAMQRRATRRRLVVLTYVALAAICAISSWAGQIHSFAYYWATFAALFVGVFLFGGHGRFGLIKPFPEQRSRRERDFVDRAVFPDPVLLNLDPSQSSFAPEWEWKNDERELARRDRAHYAAYQPLAVAFVFVLMLAACALHRPAWFPLDALLSLIYVIALLATIVAITLPSAIILWTEPDIEVD